MASCPGETPGRPRTPNVSRNSSSENTCPRIHPLSRIQTPGQGAHREVAVGDDAAQCSALRDHHGTDLYSSICRATSPSGVCVGTATAGELIASEIFMGRPLIHSP